VLVDKEKFKHVDDDDDDDDVNVVMDE